MRTSRLRLFTSAFLLALAASLLALACGAIDSPKLIRAEQRKQSAVQLSGAAAKAFLEAGEGQSLFAAFNAARFALKKQEHSPFDEKSGPGYLGMSHDQNLNAWFAEDGIRVRPTVPERENAQAWQLGFRLKEYGYGAQLMPAPPIVSQQVKGTRIEYERCFNPKTKVENPKLIEWYDNQPAGIEQGFVVNQPPRRRSYVSEKEPLRLIVALEGELRAQNAGEQIELANEKRAGILTYSHLVAVDVDGTKLAARMEASVDGREIALVVQDKGARYPIVIDPVVASLEKKLEAVSPQTNARFGFAVAIDGDTAVVGAWRNNSDTGKVYMFSRSGSIWGSFVLNFSGDAVGDQCGWSVAISGKNFVYGCPGANNGAGKAFISVNQNDLKELVPVVSSDAPHNAGDRFGASVGISGRRVFVGAPFNDNRAVDNGAVYIYQFTADFSAYSSSYLNFEFVDGNQLGAAVAVNGDYFIAGAPGVGAGRAYVLTSGLPAFKILQPSDGAAGDNFGNSVAISGNTAVIGAWGNDQKATDAGATYVFVRDANRNWSQQQKLTASDGKANDYFSDTAVAIEGNTIVVGAYAFESFNLGGATDYGKAYVFMRKGTVWTEQTTMLGDDNGGDNFGISVGISGDSVIAGARTGSASDGTSRTGAAYVYRLSCVPPSQTTVSINPTGSSGPITYCPGSLADFTSSHRDTTDGALSFQWRKNGVAIPGATSSTYSFIVRASDGGSYDLVVSNSCGSDISNAIDVSVHTFSLNPTSQNFGVSGSTGIVNVTATASNCGWVATSNASFITVNSGASGTGNGTVGFTVAANPNPGQRTGTMTIAGETFSVSQDGTNCSYSISPKSQTFNSNADTKTIAVTTNASCNWTATSNDSFISINSGASGTGNGTVTYTVAANFSTSQRTGTLTVAGQSFPVTQAGAAPTPTPTPKSTPTATPKATATATPKPTATATPQATVTATPKSTATPTATPKATPTSTPTPKATPAATPKATATATATPTATPGLVANVSTRLPVGTGDNALIEGFIVQGPAGSTKKILVRAIGPSLEPFGIPDALANPTLGIFNSNNTEIASNNNWKTTQLGGIITSSQVAEINGSGLAPSNDLESAIVANLTPGSYTAVVRGVNNSVGTGVVDAFDLSAASTARVANISTRGLIQPGDKLMIAGFIVQKGSVRVVISAVGPSLTAFGIPNALPDTTLQLRDQNGVIVRENDDWMTTQKQELENTGLQPSNAKEAALVATIPPGQYTAQVRGKPESTGIGVVQIYFLQ